MRRTLLTLGLLLILPALRAGEARAQASGNASAGVSANVINGLTVLVDQNLAFGDVANNAGTVTRTKASAGIGHLRIAGQNNRTVTVTISAAADLTHGPSGDVIPYTPGASYHESADDPATSTDIAFTGSNATTTFKLKQGLAGGNRAQAHVYLFGSIEVNDVTLTAGTYTGTVTVSATY